MAESRLLIRNRAIKPYAVIAGIQTYIDYLHENLLFFAPEGRINFAQGDVAGLTQVVNNYATMLKIPQIKPTPAIVYPFSINYLIVAGGGAAGSSLSDGNGAGGGGAGGVVSGSWLVTAAGVRSRGLVEESHGSFSYLTSLLFHSHECVSVAITPVIRTRETVVFKFHLCNETALHL